MPLPTITDTIRVSVEGLLSNGHTWANVLHFRKTSALTYPAAIAVIQAKLQAHLSTAVTGGAPWSAWAPTASSVQQLRYTPLDGISASTINSYVLAGANATDSLPGSVALVVTLRTAKRGRSYRGRVYTGPYCENMNQTAGNPLAANVTGVQTQWAGLLTSMVGSGAALVVASYRHATAEDVIAATVDARWDTQRRRLRP